MEKKDVRSYIVEKHQSNIKQVELPRNMLGIKSVAHKACEALLSRKMVYLLFRHRIRCHYI
jgi:hypothetical protein